MQYWIEGISQAFDEIGIVATREQIEFVADAVDGAHQMYGQAHGYEYIPSPLQEENKRLKRELQTQRDKRICDVCKGFGSLTTSCGPTRSATSSCWKCRGEGLV